MAKEPTKPAKETGEAKAPSDPGKSVGTVADGETPGNVEAMVNAAVAAALGPLAASVEAMGEELTTLKDRVGKLEEEPEPGDDQGASNGIEARFEDIETGLMALHTQLSMAVKTDGKVKVTVEKPKHLEACTLIATGTGTYSDVYRNPGDVFPFKGGPKPSWAEVYDANVAPADAKEGEEPEKTEPAGPGQQ